MPAMCCRRRSAGRMWRRRKGVDLMDFTDNYDMFLGEEHELLRKTVRDFAEKEVAPHIRAWDRSGAQAEGPETRAHIRPILERMGELGLLGICVPARYGGA